MSFSESWTSSFTFKTQKMLIICKNREKWRIGSPSAWRCILRLGSCSSNPPLGYKIVPPIRSYIVNPRSFPILWTFWKKTQIKQSVWSEKNVGESDWCQGMSTWRRLVAIHTHLWEISSTLLLSSTSTNNKMIREESKRMWGLNGWICVRRTELIPFYSGWILPGVWRWHWDLTQKKLIPRRQHFVSIFVIK